jgi:hypothetical protein
MFTEAAAYLLSTAQQRIPLDEVKIDALAWYAQQAGEVRKRGLKHGHEWVWQREPKLAKSQDRVLLGSRTEILNRVGSSSGITAQRVSGSCAM